MRRLLSVVLLLAGALAPAAAQPGAGGLSGLPEAAGPSLAVVVHHPYPDDADRLGFAWPDGAASGSWAARMRHLDAAGDGFDYPTLVVDGTTLLEGPPQGEGEDPQAGADRAYADAVARRAGLEAPLTLKVFTLREGDGLVVMAQAEPRSPLPGEALRLWAALVEDPVHFKPPPALSNGVEDHPFTLRALAAGEAQLDLAAGTPDGARLTFGLDPTWRFERLWVSVWVQQEAGPGLRFDPHEVVQATMHRADAGHVTVQDARGVLVESLSATWCDPCLFGDRAVVALAREHGVVPADGGDGWRYLRRPASPLLVAAAAVAGALLLAAGQRGKRPLEGGP